jgi:hypothetical protein
MDEHVVFTYDVIDPQTGEHLGRYGVTTKELMDTNERLQPEV